MINKKIAIIGMLFLMINVLHGMEKNTIIIKVDDEQFSLTLAQASESPLIATMISKRGKSQEPLDLSEYVTKNIFSYIYKDLTDQEYDVYALDGGTIHQLLMAAVKLKIDRLREKYANVAAEEVVEVIFLVENKPFTMTEAQAKQSQTLKHFLEGTGGDNSPIPLPDFLTSNIFNHVYKYLIGKEYNPSFYKGLVGEEYDSTLVSDEMIVQLINAANYLDIPRLIKKYQDLLFTRLTFVDTEEMLEKFMDLINQLPQEMQLPLSERLCAEAQSLFKALPQSEIKRVEEREYEGEQIVVSPNKRIIAIVNDDSLKLIDLENNKILWVKDFTLRPFHSAVFSPENNIIAVVTNESKFYLFDILTGKKLEEKVAWHQLWLEGFFPLNRIVARTEDSTTILLNTTDNDRMIDSGIIAKITGLSFEGLQCYYDNDSHGLCLHFQYHNNDQSSSIILDIITGKIIKRKENTTLEHFELSPDGKKIIGLSQELIRIENTIDDEGTFAWAFPKPRPVMPYVASFSLRNDLVAINTRETSDPRNSKSLIVVLNMNSAEPIWTRVVPDWKFTCFSPEGDELLMQFENQILLIDLHTKNEQWHNLIYKDRWKRIHDVRNYFISNTILASHYFIPYKNPNFYINFFDRRTGKILLKYTAQNSDNTKNKEFLTIRHNFLYFKYLDYSKLKKTFYSRLYCLDIAPLKIASFLNQPYISLDQALLIRYIFKMLGKKDQFIPTQLLNKFSYNDLPQEIKAMVEMHNQPFKEEKTEQESEKVSREEKRKLGKKLFGELHL